MPSVVGKKQKNAHEWARYVGYRFVKTVDGREHNGAYFMAVLSESCIIHTGRYVYGYVVYDPTRSHAAATSSTAQCRVSGGWRHSLQGFFDIPDPDFLYPILDEGVDFITAYKMAQKHEVAAFNADGRSKGFGNTLVSKIPENLTEKDIKLTIVHDLIDSLVVAK